MNSEEKEARARLAEQIANHNATEAELEKTRALLADAKGKLYQMLDAAEQAQSRRNEELDAEAERIISGAPKDKAKPPALIPTEADIALQRRVLDRLKEHESDGEHALKLAKRAVETAVGDVVIAKARAELIPQMERTRAEFAKLAAALNAAKSAMERGPDYERTDCLLRQEPGAACRFIGLAPGEEARWRTAIENLARDANAPLN